MSRIHDSLQALEEIGDGTERAFQLAGLISTLFKIRGVMLVVTGQLAFDSYTNSSSPSPELELATVSGKLTPRVLQEIMADQLGGKGFIHRWTVVGVPVRFLGGFTSTLPELCRDFMTDHGVVKLLPAEEMTAERILASVYPVPDEEAETQARLLLINALSDAYQMDWTALQNLCHHTDYRIGEDLARMRAAAKRDVDAMGVAPDPIGTTTGSLPSASVIASVLAAAHASDSVPATPPPPPISAPAPAAPAPATPPPIPAFPLPEAQAEAPEPETPPAPAPEVKLRPKAPPRPATKPAPPAPVAEKPAPTPTPLPTAPKRPPTDDYSDLY